MDVIHRHGVESLSAIGETPFALPIYDDATVVHFGYKPPDAVAFQNGQVHTDSPTHVEVWEQHSVDLVRPAVLPARWFRVVATGEPFDGTYRGTTVFPNGSVWHLIEVAP